MRIQQTYKYRFDQTVPAQELEDTFMLALIAVESLHGRSRVRMECCFKLDKEDRTCRIDATSQLGSDLARIFTGFATREYGEEAVMINRDIRTERPGNVMGTAAPEMREAAQ